LEHSQLHTAPFSLSDWLGSVSYPVTIKRGHRGKPKIL